MISLGKIGCRKLVSDAWKNPYVKDGLVAMYDGEWNAGIGKHDPNATVWKDLSGNGHDGTFLEAPTWYANALHSKTQDGWCNVGKVLSGLSDITIEVVVSGWASNVYLWAFNDDADRDSYGIQRYDTVNTVLYKAGGTRQYVRAAPVANIGSFGIRATSGGLATGYANSEQVTTFSFDTSRIAELTARTYAIGRGNDYGDYYHVRVYSRALTAAEIAANYAVDKDRFNLP